MEGAEYSVITVPPGVYELQRLNKEILRKFIDGGDITEEKYSFTVKPNFSTSGKKTRHLPGRGRPISLVQADFLRDNLVLQPTVMHEQ